ncbi:endoglucanase 2-like [Impatiens glandulifera]|uniref:endoglucanase 2-like n=1 Tax=Impatiens glandulifera TaxID=253017 RepID=UPI001FB172FE|nr:endoglucanase 2-like [Impatiens glandulifera]
MRVIKPREMGGRRSTSKLYSGWFLVLIVGGLIIVLAIHKNTNNSHVPVPPGFVDDGGKYAEALKVAMKFFDVQKSGKLLNNEISWRGDSGLKDGSQANLDLSKGMYDAGDHMKFGFPMAFTATVLSWAILEYGNEMKTLKQLKPAKDSLKWITDYLINAHPTDNVLYIQVGDPETDHGCWDRPENMTQNRPLIQINSSFPGTEVAAETAAAMASASLVFKDEESGYSRTLVKHAKQLFNFADEYRGYYSESFPDLQKYYNSSGYGDELLWAASWLYYATGDEFYLDYVCGKNGNDFADWGIPTWFSWDDKRAATQVLLSRISFFGSRENSKSVINYRRSAESVMCNILPTSPAATTSRTHGGLIWVSEWNALLHPIGSSFLAVLFSDYMFTARVTKLSCHGHTFSPHDLRKFAISQADYVLGENPMKMSYVIGYGDKYPEYVHHRGASIPSDATTGCMDGWKWFESTEPNPNVATGAVVGGPFLNETYEDVRNNSRQGEASTYNSALLVGLLSGLVMTTSSLVTTSF